LSPIVTLTWGTVRREAFEPVAGGLIRYQLAV